MASKRVDQKGVRSELGTIAMDLSTFAMHLYTYLVDIKRIFELQVDHIAVEGVTSMAKKSEKKASNSWGKDQLL